MHDIDCPFCGGREPRWVSSLGTAEHAQCRSCGVVFEALAEDEFGFDDIAINPRDGVFCTRLRDGD